MQCAWAILLSVTCQFYNILPHYLKKGKIFFFKSLNVKCVFDFLQNICLKHFPF